MRVSLKFHVKIKAALRIEKMRIFAVLKLIGA